MIGSADSEAKQILLDARAASARGDEAGAEALIREALRVCPTSPEALAMLAMSAFQSKRSREALDIINGALKLAPERADFHFVQGVAYAQMGDVEGAIAAFRRSIRREPGLYQSWTNLVFGLDLHYATDWQAALAVRREFNAQFCAERTRTSPPHTNDPTPGRKLRIGYVGADFRAHSAASAFGAVVLNHGAGVFPVAYYTGAPNQIGDAATEQFRDSALWRDVAGMAPEQLADRIRRDRIDILVDLAGYSAGGALAAFACRPAPVQVTAWGYLTGTGIDAMDYIFADAVTIPREHGPRYTEHIVHLPAALAYTPPADDVPIAPPPEAERGYRTYGYLGRPSKLTPLVFDAWAAILRYREGSRLLLKSDQYVDRDATHRVVNALVARGVAPDAIDVHGLTDRAEHLDWHNRVDVCLDTWPQTGGASGLDALWMGVPVVTLAGDRVPGRIGASINTAARRTQDILGTPQEYIGRAVTMSTSLDERAAIRSALRMSPILDHRQYVHAVERAYRMIWTRWCEERAGTVAA